jgi:hypothetical protein
MDTSRSSWTEADYPISWHDNHVHGFVVRAGPDGTTGELLLDLDFITEWLCSTSGAVELRVAPATLCFREVSDLRITLDYALPEAAIVPFSIGELSREVFTFPNGYSSFSWLIAVNWPAGTITFISPGFHQGLRGPARLSATGILPVAERAGGFGV